MKFHDACTLLGQLGMNGVTEKTADQKLRGFGWNKPSADGVTILSEMAWEGYPRALKYLLSKGADPNVTSGRWEKAPALGHALTNNRSSARVKVEMVEILLAAEGIDLETKVTVPKHPRDAKGAFRSGTSLEYALARAMDELKVGKAYDADSQRHARSQLDAYRKTIPLVVAAGATVSDTSKKQLKKLGVDAKEKEKEKEKPKAAAKGWAKKARALLAKKGFEKRDDVFRLCDEVLSTPGAIADKEWPGVVEAIIAASPAFEDVAEEVYDGERVSFEDDEGWLCQGWDNYVTLDLVFELLAKEATLSSPKWSGLVEKAFRAREKAHAIDYTESAIEELFAAKHVKAHRDFKKLQALEKKTR